MNKKLNSVECDMKNKNWDVGCIVKKVDKIDKVVFKDVK